MTKPDASAVVTDLDLSIIVAQANKLMDVGLPKPLAFVTAIRLRAKEFDSNFDALVKFTELIMNSDQSDDVDELPF